MVISNLHVPPGPNCQVGRLQGIYEGCSHVMQGPTCFQVEQTWLATHNSCQLRLPRMPSRMLALLTTSSRCMMAIKQCPREPAQAADTRIACKMLVWVHT